MKFQMVQIRRTVRKISLRLEKIESQMRRESQEQTQFVPESSKDSITGGAEHARSQFEGKELNEWGLVENCFKKQSDPLPTRLACWQSFPCPSPILEICLLREYNSSCLFWWAPGTIRAGLSVLKTEDSRACVSPGYWQPYTIFQFSSKKAGKQLFTTKQETSSLLWGIWPCQEERPMETDRRGFPTYWSGQIPPRLCATHSELPMSFVRMTLKIRAGNWGLRNI